ncbi:hypothetical protein AVEN_77869-1 [Araneus ventricosus]|uniref:Uncharacterized protein n=1 Tax=Araneus ventricosus TaxID=182803 RepID=A0A4Y2PM02_ARAVE|nr:hypothetical protein AVEN_77869-1 [Araneus ventricosus]
MSFLRTVECNLRRKESLDERFQRRSARNTTERVRRSRARSEKQMVNRVNSQVEMNVSEHDCGMMTEICNFCPALYWRNELNSSQRNKLPSSPSRTCTRQGILNAYHWTQLCPLRQPQFTCDLPITNNSVSQCTENSVISSQVTNVSENTANDRQNPSTEASGPVY